jgi:Histone H1-like nucleoprotein HC2/Lsr2
MADKQLTDNVKEALGNVVRQTRTLGERAAKLIGVELPTKAPAKKATAQRVPVDKPAARQALGKSASAKKATAQKAAARKASAKKAATGKAPAKKASAKKAATTKAPAKKAIAEKVPAKKARTTSDREQSAAIREWARRRGHEVASRGRIPLDILNAYVAAH